MVDSGLPAIRLRQAPAMNTQQAEIFRHFPPPAALMPIRIAPPPVPAMPAAPPAPPPNAYRASLREALTQACCRQPLSSWSAAGLAALGQGHRFRRHSQVLAAGTTPANSLWLLVSGRISLGKRDAAGRWWQSAAVEPGEWIDVSSAWAGECHPETALALTPVLVHEFPVQEVVAHCLADTGLVRALLASVAQRAQGATLDKQALLTKDLHARLAAWLLERCQASPDGQSAELVLRQQKKAIASQLGVTPETLSRSLRHLQRDGLMMMEGYRLAFPDLARLRALADRQPAKPLG